MNKRLLRSLPLVFFLPFSADAALQFSIDTYTTNQLVITLSGTFDADTEGDDPGYLAIKNDWSNNVGRHTEMWTGRPTVVSSVTIGGSLATAKGQDDSSSYNDSVFWTTLDGTHSPIAAGTEVAGTVTLTNAIFNPADAATLELVSGWDFNWSTGSHDWNRLEASSVVPIPAAAWLFGSGLIALASLKRRK